MHAYALLGGAMPVAGSMPCAKGCMAHNLRFRRPGTANTCVFRHPLGKPRSVRLFLSYVVSSAALPKAVHPVVSCLRNST